MNGQICATAVDRNRPIEFKVIGRRELPPRLESNSSRSPAAPLPGGTRRTSWKGRWHNLSNLFAQLGQPNDEAAIAGFIDARPLPEGIQLYEAAFWSSPRACFLREAILQDADWAEVADELNAELRAPGIELSA